jgi:hypothetical protein
MHAGLSFVSGAPGGFYFVPFEFLRAWGRVGMAFHRDKRENTVQCHQFDWFEDDHFGPLL